jgi:hypothetical protein
VDIAAHVNKRGHMYMLLAEIFVQPEFGVDNNGNVVWSKNGEIRLSRHVLNALHNEATKNQTKTKKKEGGPVGLYGLQSTSAHVDRLYLKPSILVSISFAYRRTQFDMLLHNASQRHVESQWLERAWQGFLSHPQWLVQLRFEKTMGSELAGGYIDMVQYAISLLKHKCPEETNTSSKGKYKRRVARRTTVIGMESTIQTIPFVPSENYHRFPRDRMFIQFIMPRLRSTLVEVSPRVATDAIQFVLSSWWRTRSIPTQGG